MRCHSHHCIKTRHTDQETLCLDNAIFGLPMHRPLISNTQNGHKSKPIGSVVSALYCTLWALSFGGALNVRKCTCNITPNQRQQIIHKNIYKSKNVLGKDWTKANEGFGRKEYRLAFTNMAKQTKC